MRQCSLTKYVTTPEGVSPSRRPAFPEGAPADGSSDPSDAARHLLTLGSRYALVARYFWLLAREDTA